MSDFKVLEKLLNCFPYSFINNNFEFVVHAENDLYFDLKDCNVEMDVKCKLLECFSKSVCQNYNTNINLCRFMLLGINKFLETHFTEVDMEQIYIHLGNTCDRQQTIRFIESGYCMAIFESQGVDFKQ